MICGRYMVWCRANMYEVMYMIQNISCTQHAKQTCKKDTKDKEATLI